MKRLLLGLPALLLAAPLAKAIDPKTECELRASLLQPPKECMRWQEVPWLTDLEQGMQLAQKEKRPLLLWISGDDPLQRC